MKFNVLTVLLQICFIVHITRFLYKIKYKLSKPQIIIKFGWLYQGVSIKAIKNKKGTLYLYHYPIFMIHRILFVTIAFVFRSQVGISIILLIYASFAYSIYLFSHRPVKSPRELLLHRFISLWRSI